jgi:hypothetical protein
MPAEQRRWRRKPIGANGFLYAVDGQQIGPCEVRDVSEGGAMLVFSLAGELPVQFVLALSRNGEVRRQCELVWRSANHFGIRFTGIRAT